MSFILTSAIIISFIIWLILSIKNKSKIGANLKKLHPSIYKANESSIGMPGITDQEFIVQLKTVIGWTDSLSRDFDFKNGFIGLVFRTINPIVNGTPVYTFDGDYTHFNLDPFEADHYISALDAAIAYRSTHDVKFPINGRILGFETGSTHDGIAAFESECFIDESDIPPIDTWFYIDRSINSKNTATLFCWIPREFEHVMQKGIDVEMMGSYFWLDERDPILNKRIFSLIRDYQ